jgi:hypothetical protein
VGSHLFAEQREAHPPFHHACHHPSSHLSLVLFQKEKVLELWLQKRFQKNFKCEMQKLEGFRASSPLLMLLLLQGRPLGADNALPKSSTLM